MRRPEDTTVTLRSVQASANTNLGCPDPGRLFFPTRLPRSQPSCKPLILHPRAILLKARPAFLTAYAPGTTFPPANASPTLALPSRPPPPSSKARPALAWTRSCDMYNAAPRHVHPPAALTPPSCKVYNEAPRHVHPPAALTPPSMCNPSKARPALVRASS
eukprot:366385-Chlamydomonas_euryale.AAC.7